jgi:excinuclease ABC subunit A
METEDKIIIRGAREHNLKNIDVEIPRDTFTVITGLSGSGKSTLAFDTIYAEGQRRYIESLSPYARQFLNLMEKPDVDLIEGLSPAISIEQKSTSHNPRSTVGTVTEIYDFMRLLYAKVGTVHCYQCGRPVERQSTDEIIDNILKKFDGKKIIVLAPLIKGRKGHYEELFSTLLDEGFTKARVDGKIEEITEGMKLSRYQKHDIELVIDRIQVKESSSVRVRESIEVALNRGEGFCIVNFEDEDFFYSRIFSCVHCNIGFEELSPNSFSFNSAYGACPECDGLGEKKEIDINLVIPDYDKNIAEGGIVPFGERRDMYYFNQLEAMSKQLGFSLYEKIRNLPKEILDIILYGSKKATKFKYTFASGVTTNLSLSFRGVFPYVWDYYKHTSSDKVRDWAESFMSTQKCSVCNGERLKKEPLAVKINGLNISQVAALSISNAKLFFEKLDFEGRNKIIARPILKEINERLEFLLNVGLDYLTLDRSAKTLSGGEAQRIRLATQIGTQLAGVLYVLDEPSIGLHQSDNDKLINSLKNLRDLGNTILVVEHDRETIEHSDYIVDLGPKAGEFGGDIIYAGKTEDMYGYKPEKSLTYQYLIDKMFVRIPDKRREGNGHFLELKGAKGNNLKNIDVKFPLGTFICITGLSGSGKSTLVNETLVKILMKYVYGSKDIPLEYEKIDGLEHIDKIIEIDQSPIGRTPRSNPSTYTGLFTFIRDLFAQLPESKVRGYGPGRFSFNVSGGRCETCQGDGLMKIEMNFLPNVYVKCETCGGKRYNNETLEVLYKGKNISEVLEMTVSEALQFFDDLPRIKRKIQAIQDVGLGYIKLGQQATTLSGGEAQRVKLATELSKISTGKTVYILDEPTTGLHFEDVKILMEVLNLLVEKGNTVIVVEHNLDVIKIADYIIDLGPKGGENGGEIVAVGTPEQIAENKDSLTGYYLAKELKRQNEHLNGEINEK